MAKLSYIDFLNILSKILGFRQLAKGPKLYEEYLNCKIQEVSGKWFSKEKLIISEPTEYDFVIKLMEREKSKELTGEDLDFLKANNLWKG